MKYELDEQIRNRVELRISPEPATGDQPVRIAMNRSKAIAFGQYLLCNCPPGPELDYALDRLVECTHWANLAVLGEK